MDLVEELKTEHVRTHDLVVNCMAIVLLEKKRHCGVGSRVLNNLVKHACHAIIP